MAAVKKAKKAKTKKEAEAALGKTLKKMVAAGDLEPIPVAVGTTIVITAEVDSGHLIPYGVSWGTDRIIDARTSKTATVVMKAGLRALGWAFDHALETTWSHKLSVKIGDEKAQVLEEKSSQNKDKPISINRRIFSA